MARGLAELTEEEKGGYIEKIYKEHKEKLFNLVYSKIRNYHNAEDIVQETFIRLYINLGRLTEANIYGWLTVVALNLVRDRYREVTRHREEYGLDLDSFASEDGQLNRIMYSELCDKMPNWLTENFRELASDMRLNPDSTYRERAERLGIPIGTVRSQTFRIKEKIRKLLKNN